MGPLDTAEAVPSCYSNMWRTQWHYTTILHMHGSGGLEFNNCARQRISMHGVDLTKFDGGGARDKEVITSIPL